MFLDCSNSYSCRGIRKRWKFPECSFSSCLIFILQIPVNNRRRARRGPAMQSQWFRWQRSMANVRCSSVSLLQSGRLRLKITFKHGSRAAALQLHLRRLLISPSESSRSHTQLTLRWSRGSRASEENHIHTGGGDRFGSSQTLQKYSFRAGSCTIWPYRKKTLFLLTHSSVDFKVICFGIDLMVCCPTF